MSAPAIFDRALLRRRLARAGATGFMGGHFLLERARDDLAERLGAVRRDFPLALDLGSPGPGTARWLAASGRAGQVVRLAPAPEAVAPGASASEAPAPGVTTLVGDEEALPLAPGRFDLAVSLLALHAVNDLPGALVQVRRVLRPDGLFVACLLGGATLTELRGVLAAAESEVEGGASPRVAPFADLRDVGGLLQRAGFALPVTDVDALTVRYADAFGLLRDLRAMGLTNALVERRRLPLRRATLMRAAALYAERHADADGRVRATFETIWLSGWSPDPSQQKPLRPGSARARLADALGTREYGGT